MLLEARERERADESLHAHGSNSLEEVSWWARRSFGGPLGTSCAHTPRHGAVARGLRLIYVGRSGGADAVARCAVR